MLSLPLMLDVNAVQLSDEQFYQLCVTNPDMRVERSAKGVLIVMPPVGGESGSQEADLITDLNIWNRKTQLGKVFSPSTIFRLPNGASRSPDAAWVEQSHWEALTPEQRMEFPPIAPDFVVELRLASPSSEGLWTDSLKLLQAKMQEYIDSGVRLGWMFNPQEQAVEIYRLGQEMKAVALPTLLNGEAVLPGFELQIPKFA
ncbi:MAG: Uma2 family endonuclease [Synechococcales cyanobacterium RU_4_20]|nr:Uma2 family endonuclease [Synechococcales cyanobacterium RU_4_20]NJR69074.1 Uma2 family endonuclease [Synechococcales cyanobacterium CRU_2_2]